MTVLVLQEETHFFPQFLSIRRTVSHKQPIGVSWHTAVTYSAPPDQYLHVLFHWAMFQLYGVFVTEVQNPALDLVEPLTSSLGLPSLPRSLCGFFLLSRRSALLPNLVISVNLQRMHLMFSSKSLTKILSRSRPSRDFGNPTSDWPPTGYVGSLPLQ